MFDLSKYMTAEERIELFNSEYPDFRMESSHQVVTDPKTGQSFFVVKVTLFKNSVETIAWVSGLAAENITTPFALEKAETSAYARAITNTGQSIFSTTKSGAKAPRASREEMEKVAAVENDKKLVKIEADLSNDWESFIEKAPAKKRYGGEETMDMYGETVKAPVTLAAGVEMLKEGLGAIEVPQCAHGSMIFKEGLNAQNKPYRGHVCPSKNRNDQCKPKWM
jgi:hypothetical protein